MSHIAATPPRFLLLACCKYIALTTIACLLLAAGADGAEKGWKVPHGVGVLFHGKAKKKGDKKESKDESAGKKSSPEDKGEALLLKKLSGITSAAKLNAPNKQGMTPLMVAASRNHRLAVCWLIAKGADVKAKNKDGKTAYELTGDIRLRELLRLCAGEKEPLDESEAEWVKKEGAKNLRVKLQGILVCYLSRVNLYWKGGAAITEKSAPPQHITYGDEIPGAPKQPVLAAANIPPECVAFLVRHGCDVNARNDDGSPVISVYTPAESIRLMLALGLKLDPSKEAEQKAALCALVAVDDVKEAKKVLKEHPELARQRCQETRVSRISPRDFPDYVSGAFYPVNLLSLAQSADMAKILIEAGADPKENTGTFSNTLSYALWSHQPSPVVKVLLKALGANAKLNGTEIDPSLLTWAQDAESARILLEAGADANAKGGSEYTPLDTAAYDGRFDVVKELLTHGAKPDLGDPFGRSTIQQIFFSEMDRVDPSRNFLRLISTENRAITPNFRARIQRMRFLPDIIRALIKAGAKVDADTWAAALALSRFPRTCDDMPLRDQLAAYLPILDALNESSAKLPTNALTTLEIPYDVKGDDLCPIFEKLIALGADPKATDENSRTVLFYVRDTQSLQSLVKAGLDINARDADGNTPLLYVARDHPENLTLDLYKAAVAAGADVKVKNKKDYTLLHATAKSGEPSAIDVARELLKAGLDVNSKDQGGETPIFHAWSKPMLDFLIQSGADPKILHKDGWTPIHNAARGFNDTTAETIRTLVKAGVDVNARSKSGRTPLYQFAETAFADSIARLLDGSQPPDYSKYRAPVLDALLEMGAKFDPKNAMDAEAIEYLKKSFKKYPIYEQIFKKHNYSLP